MTEHFQFAQPEWLYVLPFILCLIILRRRRGAEGSITYPTVRFISSLARNPQSLAGKIGAICFVLAAAALAIALARPQKVEDKTFRTVNGIDIMIDLFPGLDGFEHFLPHGPLLHAADEFPGHAKFHVRFQQGQPDVPQGVRNVLFRNLAQAPQLPERVIQFIS